MKQNYSDTFGEFKDIVDRDDSWPSERRFGINGEEALDWFKQADHPGYKAEALYSIVTLAYQEANDKNSEVPEEIADELRESYGIPLLEYSFGERNSFVEPESFDQLPYEEEIREFENTTNKHSGLQRLTKMFPSPASMPQSITEKHEFQKFRDQFEEQASPSTYDVIVAPWSSGIPLMDTISSYADVPDEKDIVVIYSRSRDINEINLTPKMEDRSSNLQDSNTLIVDDTGLTGDTIESTSEWLLNHDVDSIDVMVGKVLKNMDGFNEEWSGLDDNQIYNIY